jgi:hypothetical protein
MASEWASETETFNLFHFMYYSPGIGCPAPWTTAGAATKYDNGSLALSGILAPSGLTTALPPIFTGADAEDVTPPQNPIPNIFVEAMGPGETAVVCCPEYVFH